MKTKTANTLSTGKIAADKSKKLEIETRRNFLKKYGALAAITPIAMSMTMHSKKALATSFSDAW